MRQSGGAAVVDPPENGTGGSPDPTPRVAAPAMTPAQIAIAIVAACGVTGTKPVDAFNDGNGQGRTRVMAAAGCMARLGWDKKAAARVFRVHPNRLSPSGLQLARVWTDHLLLIAEALAAHGLCEPDDARARFLKPYEAGSAAGPRAGSAQGGRSPPGHSAPAAAAATPQHKAGGGEAEVETAVRAQADEGAVVPPRASVRASAGTGTGRPARRATVVANPVRPERASAERLRPVTDRVIRWTRQQLALGADVDFVAWCFGVDVEALAQSVRPSVGVAA